MIMWRTERTSPRAQNRALTGRKCQDQNCLWNHCSLWEVRHCETTSNCRITNCFVWGTHTTLRTGSWWTWTVTLQSLICALHTTGSPCYKFHLDQTQAYNHILIIFSAKAHKMAFRKLYIHIGDLYQLWKDRPYLSHHEASEAQADCAWYTICQNRVSLHFFKKHLPRQSKYVPFQHCASCNHGTFALVLEVDLPSHTAVHQISKCAHPYCPHSASISAPCILHTSWILHWMHNCCFPCAYFSLVLSAQIHTSGLHSTMKCQDKSAGATLNNVCAL